MHDRHNVDHGQADWRGMMTERAGGRGRGTDEDAFDEDRSGEKEKRKPLSTTQPPCTEQLPGL